MVKETEESHFQDSLDSKKLKAKVEKIPTEMVITATILNTLQTLLLLKPLPLVMLKRRAWSKKK